MNDEEGFSRLLVDVKGLSLGFDAPLFADVSFQIREGEVVEVVGATELGKRRLLRRFWRLLLVNHLAPLRLTVLSTLIRKLVWGCMNKKSQGIF